MYDAFSVQNSLKQRYTLSLLSSFALEYAIRRGFKKIR